MQILVPVGISNRHIHLSSEHVEILFGHPLTKMKDIMQPAQFAAAETVTIVGLKGSLENVRVIGPIRSETQVEILLSDTFRLGIYGEVRISGDIDNTPGCKIVGPKGEVEIEKGVIVALRHLHLTSEEALEYKLSDGDTVSVKVPGIRGGIFENIIVRASASHKLEFHIDMDEANALGVKNGDRLEIL